MAIKSILVPLEGGEAGYRTLETALVVARRFDAHIATVHISESVMKSAAFNSLSNSLQQDVRSEEKQLQTRQAETIRKTVEDFSRKHGLAMNPEPASQDGVTISFEHEFGQVNDLLVHHSRYHDTVAIARPEKAAGQLRMGGVETVVNTLLLYSGKPVVLVPSQWRPHRARHAMIAWNDSLESSRALSMTIPWLMQMDRVTVAVARSRLDGGERVRQQLAFHGIGAQLNTLDRGNQSVGRRLLAMADEIESDFLVMGGYSHSRIRHHMFGGVTDHVLAHSHIITVMVH
ncbi:MAG: universal stress protein [Gammaproteobacteria bacterium]|nr:universal stress protein [Gammaproteobacteria bacterium]MYD76291.1 universal stress protein [Gammaproteobacteria bacterium]MYJ51329.1 universal stress protein [Gammaproteobacteria bacterium]